MAINEIPPGGSGRDSRTNDELIEAALQQEFGPRGAYASSPPLPDRIGPYKVLALLGEGGMGLVYKVQQESPVSRTIALKVIKLGMDTRAIVARFEVERQSLAMMDHPNIATVVDAGTTEQGQPYFAMEYVRGSRITSYCDKNRLTLNERLDLFMPVCHALKHAHQKGIIHRDIKPANVLVVVHDGKPVPKVIDFGIARAVERPSTEATLFTEHGQLVGTPEYMSPEQAGMGSGGAIDVDTRTDVYALGVLLYELLVGVLPFDPARFRHCGFSSIQRILHEEDPPKPSTRLGTLTTTADTGASAPSRPGGMVLASTQHSSEQVAHRRLTDAATLRRRLRGDLDWITMKALEKDPSTRYASAADLAADIERYLGHEPVTAGPPGRFYKAIKFLRRNRASIIVAMAIVLTMASGLVAIVLSSIETATRQENRRMTYISKVKGAESTLLGHDIATVRRQLNTAPAKLRNWEWSYLSATSDSSLLALFGHEAYIRQAAFSRDGGQLVSASLDGMVIVWDVAQGTRLRSSRFSSDVSAGFGVNNLLTLDDTGAVVAMGVNENSVRVWDVESGKELVVPPLQAEGISAIALSDDGAMLAMGLANGSVSIWTVSDGQQVDLLEGHTSWIGSLSFSHDGSKLATGGCIDLTIRVWDLLTRAKPKELTGHSGCVYDVAFSRNGTHLASASQDNSVRLWDTNTGSTTLRLPQHESDVTSVTFNADASRVVSGTSRGEIRVWDSSNGEELAILHGHTQGVRSLVFSPVGSTFASASSDQVVRLWDGSGNKTQPILKGHYQSISSVAFSPDSAYLASIASDKQVIVWDLTMRASAVSEFVEDLPQATVAFSPNGRLVAATQGNNSVFLWNWVEHKVLAPLTGHTAFVTSLAFSWEGTCLASASADKTIRFWELPSRRALRTQEAHSASVYDVAFAPSGGLFASTTVDGELNVWSTPASTTPLWTAKHGDVSPNVAFTPDGRRVISSGGPEPLTFWNAATGKRERVLDGTDWTHIAISPDGKRFAATQDGVLKILDADTGIELLRLWGHDGELVRAVAFSPDGTRVASAGHDQTVHIWDIVPYRIRFLEREAAVAKRTGDYAEAEKLSKRAVAGLRDSLGEDHAGTLTSLRRLAESLLIQEKFAEAEHLAIECYKGYKVTYGHKNTNTVNAARLLVDLYDRWGKPDQASVWRENCSP